ncbi:unnamed protein product [Urochloa humidicola]
MDETTAGMDKPETMEEFNYVLGMESTPTDGNVIWRSSILDMSNQRDGAINKHMAKWSGYLMDIGDHNEKLEKISKGPCYPDQENYMTHLPSPIQ